ncbi:uroporphyrinogen-III C-methyltransferase [Falsirhodobacter sp. alg1]|uniref:uroporphyrinogen-III C-methyltransferase n=1 Tax=Falsirhodobacter sp. alg1 TaxID=1472418 RepID=UPI0005ED5B1D|nr:uroporphyrinogen-III C-methyltransferase [Falsirhodobacter sp. alg1]
MTVSFVSAGPGDPELLTLKAVARLQAADVVLFDDLASGPVLGHVRQGADLVAVGKRAGRLSMKQDHICRLLVEHARSGQRVVRLKSGDSGLFGRLEEELIALRAAGIDYEIIPGVPSALAAAAVAGIPLTRRETARRVQFVTGAGLDGGLPEGLNWPALADPHAVTVLFMARRTFAGFAARLMDLGLPAETSALMAEGVGHPDQKITRDTVDGLARFLGATPPGPLPALIMYGALA